jgi:glycosyltransferase 2 family protein
MISQKLIFRVALNTLLGIVFIYIWSRFVNLSEILTTLSTVKAEYIAIMVILFLLSSVLRSIRLKVLLNSSKLKVKELSLLTLLAQFLSFMIPIRAGEITKGVYLSTQLEKPFPTTVVWVFIDRFIDFYQVILIIVVSLLFIQTGLPEKLIWGSLILLIVISILSLVIIRNHKLGVKIIDLLSHLLPVKSIKDYFVSFSLSVLNGFEILHLSFAQWLKVMGVTLLAFIIDGAFWSIAFLSIGEDIGIIKGILGNGLMALTFLIPAAPGYVGSAEASGLAVWSGILGLSSHNASSGTVLFHIVTVVVLLIFGLISLYLLKFDLNQVWKKIKK